MRRTGDTSWPLFGEGAFWTGLCLGGALLLAVGLSRPGHAQSVSPDSQDARPQAIEEVRQRIEEIRRAPNQWRERLGTRLAPREAPPPPARRTEPRPRRPIAESGLTRADLRRLERRLQAVIRDLLGEEYATSPVLARELAEQFRFLPADTVRVETTVRDTVTVTDSVRAVPDTVRETRVETVERRLLDTGAFRAFEVNFAFGESTLQSRATRTLDAVGTVLGRYPELRVEIGGHTDAVGTDTFNQQLSEARAEAVRAYLIDRFEVAPDRLVARGYGEAQPIASNERRSGRALNRRVEFTVLNPEAVP